jgi:hypothetical protein
LSHDFISLVPFFFFVEALLLEFSLLIQSYRKKQKFTVGEIKKLTLNTSSNELIKFIKEKKDELKRKTDSIISTKKKKGTREIKSWDKTYDISVS